MLFFNSKPFSKASASTHIKKHLMLFFNEPYFDKNTKEFIQFKNISCYSSTYNWYGVNVKDHVFKNISCYSST